MNKFKIDIKGVSEPVVVSKEEYEFIMTMKQNRRCNHWFVIGGYTVMFGEEITLIDYEGVDENGEKTIP